jgi:hypothetical protein
MAQLYNRLWVFGDSHSTPGAGVAPEQSFWALAARHLGVATVDNCSRPKLSFDSVAHIIVGEQHQYCWDKDFFIIGLPPLERITVFDDHKDTELLKKSFDTSNWKMQTSGVVSHHGLINFQYTDLEKAFVTMHDRAWLEAQILRQLFLLTQWLDSHSASYLIVNLSKNLDSDNLWGPTQTILDYCNNHPRCEVFKNSMYDCNLNLHKPDDFHQYGWYGHHGSDGNRHFFETTIKNKLC